MSFKKKVLIVEDHRLIQEALKERLSRLQIDIVQAYCIKEAIEAVETNNDLGLIVLDGDLPDGRSFQGDFIAKVKEGYHGPILAASGMFNKELLAAGCDTACEKYEIAEKVMDMLGLSSSLDR